MNRNIKLLILFQAHTQRTLSQAVLITKRRISALAQLLADTRHASLATVTLESHWMTLLTVEIVSSRCGKGICRENNKNLLIFFRLSIQQFNFIIFGMLKLSFHYE